jgi:Tfp pilus assembly protein PilX
MRCSRIARRRGKGFFFVDVAFGLGLLGLIAVALFSAIGRQQRAARTLSDTRTAARLAEDALTSLRSGRPPAPDAGAVRLTRLPDAAPAGHAWTRATCRVGISEAQVVGLLPASVAPAAEGGTP